MLSFFKDLLPVLKEDSEIIIKIKVDSKKIHIVDHSVNKKDVISSIKFLPGSELSVTFKKEYIKTFGRLASKSSLYQ
jgi:uncharacterized protein YjfI (DUF2170 family)